MTRRLPNVMLTCIRSRPYGLFLFSELKTVFLKRRYVMGYYEKRCKHCPYKATCVRIDKCIR